MRIAIDCRMQEWSGVGRYVAGLVRALARRSDIELIQLLAPGGRPVAETEVIVVRGHPFTPAGSYWLSDAVARSRPALLHCSHFPTPLFKSVPLVVTVHDLIPLQIPASMPDPARRWIFDRMIRRAVRLADAVITPSVHTARDLSRRYDVGASSMHPIPLAADDFATGPIGRLPDLLDGKRYLLGMASPKPHKGLSLLVEAFAGVSAAHPDVLLVLFGDPGRDAAPEHPSIRCLGRVDDKVLRALYSHALAFVFPSLYEGFGFPPLEAMALGCPVVATDAASIPEVVGDAGLLVPAEDVAALRAALQRLLSDESLSRVLSEKGRARAAQFSWDRTAESTMHVYRSVLGA